MKSKELEIAAWEAKCATMNGTSPRKNHYAISLSVPIDDSAATLAGAITPRITELERTLSDAEEEEILWTVNVDAMVNPNHMSDQQTRLIFDQFDVDKNGTIDSHELHTAFAAMEKQLSNEEIADLMEEIDVNNDGQIDFDEFKVMVHKQWFAEAFEHKMAKAMVAALDRYVVLGDDDGDSTEEVKEHSNQSSKEMDEHLFDSQIEVNELRAQHLEEAESLKRQIEELEMKLAEREKSEITDHANHEMHDDVAVIGMDSLIAHNTELQKTIDELKQHIEKQESVQNQHTQRSDGMGDDQIATRRDEHDDGNDGSEQGTILKWLQLIYSV